MRTVIQLGFAAFLTITGAYSSASAAAIGESKSYHGPTGLQLYSLRDMFRSQGVAPTLDLVRQWGFKYVEVAGTYGLTPAEFKAELDKRSLVPIGSHFPYERLRDDLDGVIRESKALA